MSAATTEHMNKKVEFSILKIFTIITGILSIILPWCIIEIVYGFQSSLYPYKTVKKYIAYFFFGLFIAESPEPLDLIDYVYLLLGRHSDYSLTFFADALPKIWNYDSLRNSYLLLIPGIIYIIGLVLSLSNLNVDGRFKRTKLHGLGFGLIIVSIVIYFYVILRMVGGFLDANPHWINSGKIRDVNVIFSIGFHTAHSSAILSLVELIVSIRHNRKYNS